MKISIGSLFKVVVMCRLFTHNTIDKNNFSLNQQNIPSTMSTCDHRKIASRY